MIPDHLKPSMVFTPPAPQKSVTPQEEGVPLQRIDRQLFPGMRSAGAGVQGSGGAGEREKGPAATVSGMGSPTAALPCSFSPALPCTPAPPRNRGGRPRAIAGERRMQLLHILRRGQSRRYAAQEMGIDAASITRAIRRDPRLAIEVMEAEEEGQMFLEIYDRLYSLQETVLEPQPVVSTPQLEWEKEYLIACGLPAETVRRLRQRRVGDPPPQPLPPDPPLFMQEHSEIRVRPWKKGWRRKKAKATCW